MITKETMEIDKIIWKVEEKCQKRLEKILDLKNPEHKKIALAYIQERIDEVIHDKRTY